MVTRALTRGSVRPDSVADVFPILPGGALPRVTGYVPGLDLAAPGVAAAIFTGRAPEAEPEDLTAAGAATFTGRAPSINVEAPGAAAPAFAGQLPVMLLAAPGTASAHFTGYAPSMGA